VLNPRVSVKTVWRTTRRGIHTGTHEVVVVNGACFPHRIILFHHPNSVLESVSRQPATPIKRLSSQYSQLGLYKD